MTAQDRSNAAFGRQRAVVPVIAGLALALLALSCLPAIAHGVAGGDAAFLETATGVQFWPYLYLGAKHMFTGYDHLLFLLGVIFFLYRLRDVVIYVTMFEPDVSIVAFAVSGPHGQPAVVHVRGSVDLVQAKLSGTLPANGSSAPAAENAAAKAPRQPRA